MRLNKLILLLGLFGVSFFPKGDFENTLDEKLSKFSFNILDIEKAKMINILQGDTATISFIEFLEEKGNFEIKKRLANERLVSTLVEMVNKYSGKNLRSKKYNLGEIYSSFSSFNERINLNKEKMTGAKFYEYYDKIYFDDGGEVLPGFDSELEGLIKDLDYVLYLGSKMDTSSNPLERTVIKTFFNTLEDFSFLEEVVSKNNFNLSSIYSIISKESFGYPYVVGYSGDLNYFQINPIIMRGLHNSLKKEEEDNYFKKSFGDLYFNDFVKLIHENPKSNILAGTVHPIDICR